MSNVGDLLSYVDLYMPPMRQLSCKTILAQQRFDQWRAAMQRYLLCLAFAEKHVPASSRWNLLSTLHGSGFALYDRQSDT